MDHKFYLLFLGAPVALQAHAEIYLTDKQAAEAIFPGKKFERTELKLTAAEKDKIEKDSGERVRGDSLVVWKAGKDLVLIDQVLGKHEFITYAVGLQDGKVAGVEILEYRESFGQQIREANWRKQFVGKDKTAPLKLENDIQNISGATLSSSHVTAGVRKILHTYACLRDRI